MQIPSSSAGPHPRLNWPVRPGCRHDSGRYRQFRTIELCSPVRYAAHQIDKLAQDASFNGVDLIYGNGLKVLFNEQSTSSLTIAGVMLDSTGLGLAAAGSNFQTDYDVNVALTNLQNALGTLASQASNFGSNLSIVQFRQDFMKSMINTLKTGADNLTLADTNEEGANMLALQTRQSLSTTSLSLAAQASNNVLKLFGG